MHHTAFGVMMRTDVAVNPGCSGVTLVGSEGRLVGMIRCHTLLWCVVIHTDTADHPDSSGCVLQSIKRGGVINSGQQDASLERV